MGERKNEVALLVSVWLLKFHQRFSTKRLLLLYIYCQRTFYCAVLQNDLSYEFT